MSLEDKKKEDLKLEDKYKEKIKIDTDFEDTLSALLMSKPEKHKE